MAQEKYKVTAEDRRDIKTVKAKLKRLSPAVQKDVVDAVVQKQVRGFVDFLREQSVVGLAIGLVLGTQAKQLVDQLVNSFFNPFIGLILPGEGTLAQKSFDVSIGGKSAEFGWGAFVVSLMTFILVAAVVFYIFKGLRLDKLDKKKE